MRKNLRFTHSLALVAFVVLMMMPGIGRGQLFTDNFSYTVGTALSANGWGIQGVATPTINVTAALITYPGYLSSGIGDEVSLAVSGQDVNHTFTSQTTGTVYASCLVNVASATTTGDYFFHLGPSPIGSTFQGRVFVKKDVSGNLAFGISRAGAVATAVFTPFSYTVNTTYLLVLRYTIVANASNDLSAIYINPTLNTIEPATGWISSTDASTDLANIGSVALRQGGPTTGAALKLDGIRVATTWADIVGTSLPLIDLNNTGFAQITTDGTPNPGVTKVVLSKFKADVTTANATLNTLAFITAGTYAAANISKFELYYSGTSTMPGTSLANTTTIPATGGTVSFSSLNTAINTSNSGYFWITCDIAPSATATHTIGALGTGSSGLVLTFASGTPTGTIADPLLQTITASSASPQTITFTALSSKTYGDAPYALGATASSGLTVSYSSSNTNVATISGNTVTIVGSGSTDITASQTGNSSFLPAPDVTHSLLVNTLGLTVTGAVASNKPYDGNNTAAITEATLVGVINSDDVTVSGGGTFAIVNVGTGIVVTAALSLGGTRAGNYLLAQPTGLAADITEASQTITFASLSNKVLGSAPFTLTATATSGLTVSFVSSDETVATISGNTVTIVGIGTTSITASQAGNANYLAASDVLRTLTVTPLPIAAWDFSGVGVTSLPTFAATTFSSNLISSVGASDVTRGSNAAWSTAANSYRTQGFKSEGINVANTDYFEIRLQPAVGKTLSLSTIDANLSGTGSFCASPGVTSQFAYSLNGTNFTLISSALVTVGGPVSLPQIDLSGISPLQNVNFGTTVTLRYYASGQTTTGGWGFYSAAIGTNGLSIGGSISNAVTTYTGTGNWSTSGSWSNGIPTSTQDAIIDGNVTIDVAAETKDLTIINYQTVTINDTKSLTVNGTLTNYHGTSGLVINTGGQLKNNTAGVDATVNLNVTGGTLWHLFCLPTTTGITASPFFDLAYIDEYVEGSAAWNRLGNASTVNPNTGYSINYVSTTPLSFTGLLNNNAGQSLSGLSFSEINGDPDYEGWHLLGNTFTCGIDAALISATGDVNGSVYVWDEGGSGNYLPYSMNGAGPPNGTIAPMQGFFVKVTTSTNTLNIPTSSKTIGGSFLKSISNSEMLTLSIAGNNYSDKTYVKFNTEATANFDQAFDAYKRSGIDAAPQLYSILPGEKAAVNTLPDYTTNTNVPLGLKVGAATTYTLTVDGINSFDPQLPLRLDDLKLGTSQDLRAYPTYSFTASPGDTENRFRLRFASAIGIDEHNTSGLTIYTTPGIIHIAQNSPASGTAYLYSVSGQLLSTSALNSGETLLRANAQGVYMVKVVSGKTLLTQKVVVTQ